MALEITSALTAAIEGDLTEAAATFPDASLQWRWQVVSASAIQFQAKYLDSDRSMRLVIEVDVVGGPSLSYTSADVWFEESEALSSTQTRTNKVKLPEPSDVERAGFVNFTAVLQYVKDWRDRLAGP